VEKNITPEHPIHDKTTSEETVPEKNLSDFPSDIPRCANTTKKHFSSWKCTSTFVTYSKAFSR
jgi:hypothetical protein